MLPAAGRDGDPPRWPLSRQRRLERELWASEWRRPQALMWERLGLALEVALYVRQVYRAETAQATAADRTLVLRMRESLGLSTSGLQRNRWRIVDASQPSKASSPGRIAAAGGARERFRVLDGGG